ncbi:MAG: phosphorylase family protein [Acidobacteriota bacterium]
MPKQAPSRPPSLLLFVATPGEERAVLGAPLKSAQIVRTGIGPANAARAARQALAALPSRCRPLVAVAGIGGALSPSLAIGDVVLGTHARSADGDRLPCCPTTLVRAADRLTATGFAVHQGDHLTTTQVVCQAAAKRELYVHTKALVVDMESYAIAQVASRSALPLLLLRVISDDAHRDLPNLNAGLDSNYGLRPLGMTATLLSHPVASVRFLHCLRYALMKLRQAAGVCLMDVF